MADMALCALPEVAPEVSPPPPPPPPAPVELGKHILVSPCHRHLCSLFCCPPPSVEFLSEYSLHASASPRVVVLGAHPSSAGRVLHGAVPLLSPAWSCSGMVAERD